MSDWPQFLDDYEAKIDSTRLALETGSPLDPAVLVPFEPPTDLGPLPEQLRGRALDVLRSNEELERRLTTSMETIGRELAETTRSVQGAQRYSAFGESVIPKYFDGNA